MIKLTPKQIEDLNRINPATLVAELGKRLDIAQPKTGTPVNAIEAKIKLNINSVVTHGETISINNTLLSKSPDVYEFLTDDAQVKSKSTNIAVNISANAVKATVNLVVDTQPTASQTITIGNKLYTFVAVGADNADGKISVGADLATAKVNIVAAINGSGFNQAHPLVTASAFTSNTCVITAKIGGSLGNGINTTETMSGGNNAFSATKLSGGTDCSYTNALIALNNCINLNDTHGVRSELGTGQLSILAKIAGVAGNSINVSETLFNGYFVLGSNLSGGVNGTVGYAGETYINNSSLYIAVADNSISGKNWSKIDISDGKVNDVYTSNTIFMNGDGITFNDSAINTFIDSIGSEEVTLLLHGGIYLVNTDISFPTNVRIIFENGSRFKGSVGTETMTLNGSIDAGFSQIFENINIAGAPEVSCVRPEWFGADSTGVADNTSILVKSINLAKNSKRIVELPAKIKINSPVTLNNVVVIGRDSDIIFGSATAQIIQQEESELICNKIDATIAGHNIPIVVVTPSGNKEMHGVVVDIKYITGSGYASLGSTGIQLLSTTYGYWGVIVKSPFIKFVEKAFEFKLTQSGSWITGCYVHDMRTSDVAYAVYTSMYNDIPNGTNLASNTFTNLKTQYGSYTIRQIHDLGANIYSNPWHFDTHIDKTGKNVLGFNYSGVQRGKYNARPFEYYMVGTISNAVTGNYVKIGEFMKVTTMIESFAKLRLIGPLNHNSDLLLNISSSFIVTGVFSNKMIGDSISIHSVQNDDAMTVSVYLKVIRTMQTWLSLSVMETRYFEPISTGLLSYTPANLSGVTIENGNVLINDNFGYNVTGNRSLLPTNGVDTIYFKITDLITFLGSEERTLVFPAGTYLTTASFTVPANLSLKFENGAKLNGSGATETITVVLKLVCIRYLRI
jgi:hypothetical protein